jgi:hypothetical protein
LMSACADQSKENLKELETENQKKESNWLGLDTLNFSVQYPPEWELNKTGEAGTSFVLSSPEESNQDQFRENVNLLIQDLNNETMDLGKYTTLSEDQIKKYISNSNILESKRVKTATEEYQKLLYLGDQGILHLKFEQYYFKRDKKVYVLTFTAEQSKFMKYHEMGESIMDSFKILRVDS